jgi:Domain of unknown function (DUF6894)
MRKAYVKAGDTVLSDDDGIDLPNLDKALTDAVASAKDLVENIAKNREIEPSVVVTNEAGDVITTVQVGKV